MVEKISPRVRIELGLLSNKDKGSKRGTREILITAANFHFLLLGVVGGGYLPLNLNNW